jgi:hypothetical protein
MSPAGSSFEVLASPREVLTAHCLSPSLGFMANEEAGLSGMMTVQGARASAADVRAEASLRSLSACYAGLCLGPGSGAANDKPAPHFARVLVRATM